MKGCKQKELIPVICDRCGQNFCLRHRHAQDHACSGGDLKKPLSQAALAALSRSKNSPSSTSTQQATSQKPATVVNKGNCQPHHPNGIRVPVESRIQGNLVRIIKDIPVGVQFQFILEYIVYIFSAIFFSLRMQR